MVPSRTHNETAAMTLPEPDRQLEQEEFLRLYQSNPMQLWERMITFYVELENQIKLLEAEHHRELGALTLITIK